MYKPPLLAYDGNLTRQRKSHPKHRFGICIMSRDYGALEALKVDIFYSVRPSYYLVETNS